MFNFLYNVEIPSKYKLKVNILLAIVVFVTSICLIQYSKTKNCNYLLFQLLITIVLFVHLCYQDFYKYKFGQNKYEKTKDFIEQWFIPNLFYYLYIAVTYPAWGLEYLLR